MSRDDQRPAFVCHGCGAVVDPSRAFPFACPAARQGDDIDHVLELSHVDRKRIFNLGYFTWVEQQGVSLEDFEARSRQSFWDGLLDLAPAWDAMITEFNARSGAAAMLS